MGHGPTHLSSLERIVDLGVQMQMQKKTWLLVSEPGFLGNSQFSLFLFMFYYINGPRNQFIQIDITFHCIFRLHLDGF